MTKYTEYYNGEIFNVRRSDIHAASTEYNTFTTVRYVASWKWLFQDFFLPRGYPQSVSADYMNYQIWDSVQAFASSMSSGLATEAVLRGVGVGNKAASAMAAAITWLLKDGCGMLARIFFAWLYSPSLDANCKQWRLIADCCNDLALCMDLITPALPNLHMPVMCFSSMIRAVVGVAGGVTRNTVVNHQAVMDNVGDVSAKDGSQETLINVFALFCSLLLLPSINGNPIFIWLLFCFFTAVHLYGNYHAVKSLHFRSLNESLLRIVVKNYVETRRTGSVGEVNSKESMLLHWNSQRYYGYRLSDVPTSSSELLFVCSKFIVSCDLNYNHGYVSMASISNTSDQLRAALCLELMLKRRVLPTPSQLDDFIERLKVEGWLINKHRLVFDRWTYCEK